MTNGRLRLCVILAGLAGGTAYGQGQPTYGYRPDPCMPTRGLFGGFVAPSDQQRAACLAERKAQWDAYNAQQRAQQQARDAEAAAQEAAQREAQARERRERAEQLAAEKRREREELIQRRDAYTKLISAEFSPDNHCKTPDTARLLLEQWSDFYGMKQEDLTAVDIEHLTTTEFDPADLTMTCHGIFVTNRGIKLAGSLQIKKNVAGDPLFTWTADSPQDLSAYIEPPPLPDDIAPPSPPLTERVGIQGPAAAPSNAPIQSASFAEGLADRQSWETWLSGLPPDEARGAKWWATNRNSPGHTTCALAAADDAAFAAGCMNAQGKLAPVDVRRRSDPEFKKGWNSL
jgi:hypothetical protein